MKHDEAKPPSDPPFDQSLAQLEEIVGHLEAGELPLEEALQAFERGVGLVRQLNRRLSEAESRVEVLTKSARGDLEVHPLETDDSEG